jgi:hypothetical protein
MVYFIFYYFFSVHDKFVAYIIAILLCGYHSILPILVPLLAMSEQIPQHKRKEVENDSSLQCCKILHRIACLFVRDL